MAIILDDLKPISASFELRYAPQFTVWDRSGTIWTEMAASYPHLANKQAQPNSVAVSLAPHLDALVSIDRAHVGNTMPNNKLVTLKEAAGSLTPIIVKHLPIEQFTRTGMRLIFQKEFPRRELASDYLHSAVALPLPRGKVMNVDGRSVDPSYSFRWEGDKLGFHLRLAAVQNQINVDFPPEYAHLTPPESELTLNRVIVDIDYYSHALVSVDQLKAEDLIENWLHVIRRDISNVIPG
jgi:hypothetical protein